MEKKGWHMMCIFLRERQNVAQEKENMKVNLTEIKAPHRKDRDEEIDKLVASIEEVGMIEPIILNERNEIISGKRRYYAAKKLKMSKVDVVYFEKAAVDQELAAIDSNLVILPLGEVDHDLALARRKKLYEQKHPDVRQHAPTAQSFSKAKPFTKDVADTLGLARRTIERAVERATKSSPSVNNARREGTLSSSVVNELIRLPTSYQDKVLDSVKGRSIAEVKNIVSMALEKDADYAVSKVSKLGKSVKVNTTLVLGKNMDKLKESLELVLARKIKCEPREAAEMIKKADEVIALLEKFVEQSMPVHKPILRKHVHEKIAS